MSNLLRKGSQETLVGAGGKQDWIGEEPTTQKVFQESFSHSLIPGGALECELHHRGSPAQRPLHSCICQAILLGQRDSGGGDAMPIK